MCQRPPSVTPLSNVSVSGALGVEMSWSPLPSAFITWSAHGFAPPGAHCEYMILDPSGDHVASEM